MERLTLVLPARVVIAATLRTTVVVAVSCGAPLGVAALSFKALDETYPLADVVLDGASGFLWLAAGTLAHLRRPTSRVGLLMVAVGIGWFAEDLQLSRIAVVFTLGLLLTAASSGVLVHLVLAQWWSRVAATRTSGCCCCPSIWSRIA